MGGTQPTIPFAGFLNINSTHDISISLTKVKNSHTFKSGFYNTHSYKAQQQNSGATFGRQASISLQQVGPSQPRGQPNSSWIG